jgi:hypothetical protein
LNNPTSLLPAVPPQMPQVKPNAFLRWLARCTLRMGGWKVTGTLPDIPRLVFIIARIRPTGTACGAWRPRSRWA